MSGLAACRLPPAEMQCRIAIGQPGRCQNRALHAGEQASQRAGRRVCPPAVRAGLQAPAARHPPKTCRPPLQAVQGSSRQYRSGRAGQGRQAEGRAVAVHGPGAAGRCGPSRQGRHAGRQARRQMQTQPAQQATSRATSCGGAGKAHAPASRATSHSVPIASTLAGYFSSSPRRFSWTWRGAAGWWQAGMGRQAVTVSID